VTEAGRCANLWLSVLSGRHQDDATLAAEHKPPSKPPRKPHRRLEKIADLALAFFNGYPVLCSEVAAGGFYVFPRNGADGPLFELYRRRAEGPWTKTK